MMGLFGSSKSKLYIPPQVTASLEDLYNLTKQSYTAPIRDIAGFSDLEQQGLDIIQKFINAPESEQRKFVESQVRDFATEKDITKMPEYESVINRIVDEGNLIANRLSRGLRMTGNAPTQAGAGRDMLGRSVGETQERLMAVLAPYASQERGRRFGALETLEGLETGKEQRMLQKAGVASEAGQAVRSLDQAVMDALYTAQQQELTHQWQTVPNILQSIIQGGGQLATVTGGEPSTFSQLLPLAGPILTSILQGGGQDGQTESGGQGIDWAKIATTAGSIKLFMMCVPEGTAIDTPEGQKNVEDVRAGDVVYDKDGTEVKVQMKYEFDQPPTSDRFLKLDFDTGASVTICDLHRIDGVYAKDLRVGEKGLVSKEFVEMDRRSYDIMTEGTDGSYRSNGIPINTMIPELHSRIREAIERE